MVVASDFVWARPQEISFPNAAPFRAGVNGGKVNHLPPLLSSLSSSFGSFPVAKYERDTCKADMQRLTPPPAVVDGGDRRLMRRSSMTLFWGFGWTWGRERVLVTGKFGVLSGV